MCLSRWVAGVSAGALALSVLAGCGGSQDTATDSTSSATATTASVTASPPPVVPSPGGPVPTEMVKPAGTLTPEQEAVLVAYQAYWQKCIPAAHADPEHAVEHIRECADQDTAERFGGATREAAAQGSEAFGAPILHPQSPVIANGFATVRDCQDNRNFGQRRKSDGKIEVLGLEQMSYETGLEQEGGVWKVVAGNPVQSGNLQEFCA